MDTFSFCLKFWLPPEAADPSAHIDRLAESGCDDALVGIGQPGRIALDFDREAPSAVEAITTAIRDVTLAIPGARLIEATPDLVGLSDLASIMNVTRQYARKMVYSPNSAFPLPVHEGNPSLWRLFPVVEWLSNTKRYAFDARLRDVSYVTMQVNLARDDRNRDTDMQHLLGEMVVQAHARLQ